MQIGIFSDSHGSLSAMKRAIDLAVNPKNKLDAAFHLGDGAGDVALLAECFLQVFAVRGNCDFSTAYPVKRMERLENIKVFAAHGHEFGVKAGMDRLIEAALRMEADVVLFGHTHLPLVCRQSGVLFVNPGSVAHPANGLPSFAILTLENGKANARIVEI